MTRKYGEDLYGADFTKIAFYELRTVFWQITPLLYVKQFSKRWHLVTLSLIATVMR